MSDIIEINTTILGAGELAKKIKEVADIPIPNPPKNLTDKYRWIQCTLKNETQFDIIVLESYFDSGHYWEAPGSCKLFNQLVFSCCNMRDGAPTGVAGGTLFRLLLDNRCDYNFALGWSAPLAGSYKAGVVESSNPMDGYDAANKEGGSIESKHAFKGKDKDGKPAKFRIHISASPGQQPLYVVKQVLVD